VCPSRGTGKGDGKRLSDRVTRLLNSCFKNCAYSLDTTSGRRQIDDMIGDSLSQQKRNLPRRPGFPSLAAVIGVSPRPSRRNPCASRRLSLAAGTATPWGVSLAALPCQPKTSSIVPHLQSSVRVHCLQSSVRTSIDDNDRLSLPVPSAITAYVPPAIHPFVAMCPSSFTITTASLTLNFIITASPHTIRPPTAKKIGSDPAAGSPTATLLRLTSYPAAEARGSHPSPQEPSETATGGVYKLQGPIRRGQVRRPY